MDIATIKTTEIMFEILDPRTDQPLGITISLRPLDDEIMKRLSRKINDERLVLQRRGKTFDAKKIEDNTQLLLFTAMAGWDWRGDTTFHGEKPIFNETIVYSVFNELPWFQSQLEDKLSEYKSFFQL